MRQSSRARTAAYVVTFAWSIALLVAGVHLSGTLSKGLTALPTLIVVAFWLFDHQLWRRRPLCGLARMPDLRGTWKGTLVSYRADGDGEIGEHAPIPVFLIVDQTYISLDIRLISAESKSHSFAAAVQKGAGQEFTIYYHYSNTPGMAFRRWSPMHAGASRIDVGGVRPTRISGEYWTDRDTKGTYEVSRQTRDRYYSWEDAVEADERNGGGGGWTGRIGCAGRQLGRAIRRARSGTGPSGR